MKRILMMACMASMTQLPMMADNDVPEVVNNEPKVTIESSEFEPAGTSGEGFLTSIVNRSLEKAFDQQTTIPFLPLPYGRNLTDLVTPPKLGAYFISKYGYSDQKGKHGGDAFSQRLIRAYIDGTILLDFKYRVQVQVNNSSFHMKDYFVEWAHWKEFAVKVGQYKRAFLFENPYNPWDVGFGDYSQIVKKLAGMGDYNGEPAATGGRDQGIQVQGDLFPSKSDGHRYLHYQFQMMNGQGINTSDANGKRDFIGTLQVQPVKGLTFGIFGWTGNYTSNGVTVDRNRWAAAVKYENKGWSARAEYAHSQGHKIAEYNAATDTFSGTGRADGWYATIGVPCTDWLKVYAKYDAYRDQATWGSNRTMYSVIPNFQIHKNLMLQVQYNHVHDCTSADRNYNEIWAEAYVRF